jgi:diguanylate cyclase (GGDEF)-like protein
MSPRISSWLRASLQGTTLLGVVMIALTWSVTVMSLQSGKQADLDKATSEASNLARAFDEHIARTIRGTDNTLIVLRSMYLADRKGLDFIDWSGGLTNDLVLHYAVVNAGGTTINSSRNPVPNLPGADPASFHSQTNAASDDVQIGRAVDGQLPGKVIIQLSRRLVAPDGTFTGQIVASLDTAQLVSFYKEIDIGREGSISVVGLDGHVRAWRGFKANNIAALPANRGVLARFEKAQSGTYMNDGRFDGVKRLVSYRKVAGLPLIVVVGLAEHEVLATYRADQIKYYALAAGITALILIVMMLSIVHRDKLNRTYTSLQKSELVLRTSQRELRTTLDNMDQGILMADATGNVAVINRRLIRMLDLPPDWASQKITIAQMLSHLRDRGEFGEDGDLLDGKAREVIRNGGTVTDARSYERMRPNGRILEIRISPLPEGGTVRTFSDITERKRAETKIAEMATHDDLTGLANRKLFRERVQQAIGRTQRYGECFSILLLDLDRFKEINDTRGHPAGDAVLKEAARRLSICMREHDTVARLGGDEFAILQSNIRADHDTGHLAERIIKIFRAPFHLEGEQFDVATSIGIAVAPDDGADYDRLVKKADEALYRAKDAGGSLFCFHRSGFRYQNKASPAPGLARAVS